METVIFRPNKKPYCIKRKQSTKRIRYHEETSQQNHTRVSLFLHCFRFPDKSLPPCQRRSTTSNGYNSARKCLVSEFSRPIRCATHSLFLYCYCALLSTRRVCPSLESVRQKKPHINKLIIDDESDGL